MSEITKEWLEEVGFRILEKPDRRKRGQCTKYSLCLPYHLIVKIDYWEYPRDDILDAAVVSSGTYGGGPLYIPTERMKTREQLCKLIECLSGVNLLERRAATR